MTIKRSYIAACHDIFMAALSIIISLYLRLGDDFTVAYVYLPLATVTFTLICAAVFISMRLYRGLWRYASVPDLIAIVKSVTLAILIFIPVMFFVTRLDEFPRSVLVINWLMLIVMLGGPRLLYRALKDKRLTIDFNSSATDKRIPVLIAGLNDNAELFIRETFNKTASEYRVVGIITPAKEEVGRQVHGIRVVGTYDSLESSIEALRNRGLSPQKIVLSDPFPATDLIKRFLDTSNAMGLTLARLPRRSELQITEASSQQSNIQPIVIEDLLGRSQAALDIAELSTLVKDKTILVTGAGGTIGGELVRQIVRYEPKHILLFDISEISLYKIDREVAALVTNIKRSALIGDVMDRETMEYLFSTHSPQFVFHAAAIKHVPIAEDNIVETIKTNALGTQVVADCALTYKAQAMIMISTDKAVNPTSVMGATKRLAERYCQSLGSQNSNHDTHFVTVRFGNVLGSSGSVIPLFRSQIEQGGPITITHPDIERFFMTVREAVELVLQSALQNMKSLSHSDIYVLNMGQPVKIVDLAHQMIRMSGLRPDIDIKIDFVGLRPGEKLFEELFYEDEASRDTESSDILLVSSPILDYDTLSRDFRALAQACKQYDIATLKKLLLKLVPLNQLSLD